jgi:hypothetical protein
MALVSVYFKRLRPSLGQRLLCDHSRRARRHHEAVRPAFFDSPA